MNDKLIKGLALGAVAIGAVMILAPSVVTSARPVLRRGIKNAVRAYQKGREAIAELQEMAEDAYAEAWSELDREASHGFDRTQESTSGDVGAGGRARRHAADHPAGEEAAGEPTTPRS